MAYTATWRMTLDDFKVLTTAHKRRRRSERFIRFADPLFLGGGALLSVYFFWAGDAWYGMLFAFYVVILLAIRNLLGPWAIRRRFAAQRLGENDLEMTADDEGVTVIGEHMDSKLKWSGVERIDALDADTILWTSRMMGILIPDRAFASPTDARAFAAFAEEKIDAGSQ